VDWANSVIRKRPGTKWIIVTHACLNPAGRITGYSGYGATSPAYLRDRLVRPNRNVRVVLCGHIGRTAVTKDRHATWMLTNRTVPGRVRILDIDGSTIRTRMAR
jgi:hypothetical protein